MERLHTLKDPCIVDLGAFEDVGSEEADEGEDDKVVIDFQVAVYFEANVDAGDEE